MAALSTIKGNLRGRQLARAEAGNDGVQGFKQYQHVQRKGKMLDVVKIVLDFNLGFVFVAGIALGNLRPAGKAGFDDVAVAVKRDAALELIDKIFLLGARADQTHVALQDIEKLRQLVQAGFADKAADAGDARVALLRQAGAVFSESAHMLRNL